MADYRVEEETCVYGFLDSFPTYRLHSKPSSPISGLWVFSSLFIDDVGNQMMIYDKIITAFSKMNMLNNGFIVQFWAPVKIDGKHLLSTSGQPFAVDDLGSSFKNYRRLCVENAYDIDVNSSKFRGTPACAFLNRFPEIASLHEVDLLLRNAFHECTFNSSIMIPICCPSQTSSSSDDCIGVIECSSWLFNRVHLFNEMNTKIKVAGTACIQEVGLSVYNVQHHIPYKTINGLKLARDQIQEALKSRTLKPHALKLTGYSTASHLFFKDYYDACDIVPLRKGEELVEKTLQDYQPRFCENISQLATHTLMASVVSTDEVQCSGFTICMSIGTGDFSCAFEFIWHHNPNFVLLLEALLFTLKRCLPRFNFGSGAELGDQLHVIDAENSTKSETKFFEIFKEKRLEPINKGKKAMVVSYNSRSKEKRNTTEKELSREDIEQHYGKTMKKAAEELGVSLSTLKRKHNKLGMSGWQGPDLPQRKAYNSKKNQSNQSHTHEKDNGVIQDPSPVKRNDKTVIKAEYADDIIKLHLGISELTFVTVENEIGKKFKLKHGTFKIKYLDEDEEWILMTSDQDLSDCIQNSRNVDRSAVRLRVLLHNQ
ncbi:NIN-like protein [Tanacetum coccineum]